MRRFCMVVAITAMLGVTLPVRAEVVTFDDLGGTIEPLPSSYKGFDWSGSFYYLNPELYHPVSGYMAGMVSSPNVAFNGYGDDVSVSQATPFTFNGAYFAGAWNDGLQLDIGGWLDGSKVHSTTITLSSTDPIWADLNWTNVDMLTFHSYAGTVNPNYDGGGNHFVMDNFTTNTVVPLPAGVILGALGLSVAGWRLKRKTA